MMKGKIQKTDYAALLGDIGKTRTIGARNEQAINITILGSSKAMKTATDGCRNQLSA